MTFDGQEPRISSGRPASPGAHDLLIGVAFFALGFLLYARALSFWWTLDDPFHLHYIIQHRPWEYCFKPTVWRELPFKMFTPLLLLSLDFDRWVVGLRPHFFYAHQLAAFGASLALLYAVFRLWFGRAWSAVGAGLFVLGAPLCFMVGRLPLRHYVEGLLLALLAVWCHILSIRRNRRWLLWASAASYFLAMLCKEVYVPLLFLLWLLPEVRARKRALAGHALALVAYLAWRWIMLGTLGGGYGWAVGSKDWPSLLLSLPGKILRAFVGHGAPAGWVLVIACGVVIAAGALRSPRTLLPFLGAGALVSLPVAPVAAGFEDRYAVLPWLIVSAAAVWFARELYRVGGARRRLVVLSLAVGVVAAVIVNRSSWGRETRRMERMSQEGLLFMRLGPSDILVHPVSPPFVLDELSWLKENYFHLPGGAAAYYDDLFLCTDAPKKATFWTVKESPSRVEEITAEIPKVRRQYCANIRPKAPLNVALDYLDGALSWSLGPYGSGRYRLVLADGREAFDVSRQQGYQFFNTRGIALRFSYIAPEGWTTYSPELGLDFEKQRAWRWSRP